MDEDLLDKYFAGQCMPDEAAKVRQWLDQPVADENIHLKRSWRNIAAYIHNGAIRPLNPWFRYFVAASIALISIGGLGWKLLSNDFLIQNNSGQYEAFNSNGLQLKLPPQAAARINNGVVSKSADLNFCGNVWILNNTGNDVDMKLNLNCVSAKHPNFTTVLRAKKDRRYVAFQYQFKSAELVVVEEERIFDLPLPLQQKAMEVLEI